MKIGSSIEQLRKARGLTLDDLEDQASTTKSSLSKIEKDKQWPRPDTLKAIAAAFGVKVYQIFALAEGVDLPESPPNIDQAEIRLLENFRSMDEDQKEVYLKLAETIIKPPQKKRGPSF